MQPVGITTAFGTALQGFQALPCNPVFSKEKQNKSGCHQLANSCCWLPRKHSATCLDRQLCAAHMHVHKILFKRQHEAHECCQPENWANTWQGSAVQ